jgi:dTDP-4-dehydrorhamnose 3,5-epimerase
MGRAVRHPGPRRRGPALKLIEADIPGVCVIELEPAGDERGFFARIYDERLSARMPHISQASISFNPCPGTLRGMHYQRAPFGETKIVRCSRGAIYDVVLDLDSTRWFGIELTPDNGRMLLLPEGTAHGFQTLRPDTEVSYLIAGRYEPEAAAGVRWNDPAFDIRWPLEPAVISDRDRAFPDFVPGRTQP